MLDQDPFIYILICSYANKFVHTQIILFVGIVICPVGGGKVYVNVVSPCLLVMWVVVELTCCKCCFSLSPSPVGGGGFL